MPPSPPPPDASTFTDPPATSVWRSNHTSYLQCPGWPQPRVYLEGQQWFTAGSDGDVTQSSTINNLSRHIHLGLCFPYLQPISNWLTLQILIQLHGNQPFNALSSLRVDWLTPWGWSGTPLAQLSPVPLPGCYLPRGHADVCNTTVTLTIDTRQAVGMPGDVAGSPNMRLFDGVTALRVSVTSPTVPACGVVMINPRNASVLDPQCAPHTAGIEAPVILNNRGTYGVATPRLPSMPAPFPVGNNWKNPFALGGFNPLLIQGLAGSSVPWNVGNAATNMALQGWLPGWNGSVVAPITDEMGLVLPAYGATCLGSVGIKNRMVVLDATFIPLMAFSALLENTTTLSDFADNTTLANAAWVPTKSAITSSTWSPAAMGLAPGEHKVTFRTDSVVRGPAEVFNVSTGGMGATTYNLTGINAGANSAVVMISFNYQPM